MSSQRSSDPAASRFEDDWPVQTPVVEPGHPLWQFVAAVCTWWPPDRVPGSAREVLASADRLLDATWTPALDEMVQLPRSARDDEVAELVPDAVRELGLRWPDPPAGMLLARDLLAGIDATALPAEHLQLGLERVHEEHIHPPFTGFTVDIDGAPVNRGAACGVGPRSTLTPLLDADPGTVLLQIDNCGCQGCLDRDVRITRVDGLVCWEWIGRRQVRDEDPRGVARCDVFRAEQHDAEIRRLLAELATRPD